MKAEACAEAVISRKLVCLCRPQQRHCLTFFRAFRRIPTEDQNKRNVKNHTLDKEAVNNIRQEGDDIDAGIIDGHRAQRSAV